MTNSDRELMRDLLSEAKEVTYREAIVTFVDILGFKALVDEQPAHVVAAAIERLQQSVQPADTKTKGKTTIRAIDSLRVHAFSDCVVRVRWIEGPDDLGPTFIRELADLATIQASLSRAGVFVRGGVTIGEIHSSETVVFGPGLIRAYKLEDELAHVPRIVIDPAAIQRFHKRLVPKTRMTNEIAAMRRAIRHADDGLWFVDYLRAGAAALDGDAAVRAFLKQHRGKIVEAAANVDVGSSVLPKYLWTAKYHNSATARILKSRSVPGITISKTQLPSFERLRPPILLSH